MSTFGPPTSSESIEGCGPIWCTGSCKLGGSSTARAMPTTRRRLDDRSALLGRALRFGEEVLGGHLIGYRERDQGAERHVDRAAFDATQVLGVNADPFGRLLLGKASFFSKAPDALTELALLAQNDAFERT